MARKLCSLSKVFERDPERKPLGVVEVCINSQLKGSDFSLLLIFEFHNDVGVKARGQKRRENRESKKNF